MNSDLEMVKREYRALFDAVSAALFELDPVGISFEDNRDEYDSEAGTIIPRLREANSKADLVGIVHEEFCRWFGSDTAGPKEAYTAASEKIWELWSALHAVRGSGTVCAMSHHGPAIA